MSAYSEFFLNSQSSVVQLDCLELSHSSFSQTFYIVRNSTLGVTVTHEDASVHAYEYCPMRLSMTGPRDDLEQVLRVELGDLGEIIPDELDRIRTDDTFSELPRVVYRTYRSDDLENVLYGPILLELKVFTFTKEGAAFDAQAPSLNVSRTGETYSIARFPMLRGML